MERNLVHEHLTKEIIGAALEVRRVLGVGFLESLYEEAMVRELTRRRLCWQQQAKVPVYYKDELIGTHVLDILVENKVVVELKAIKELANIHSSIVLSYLAATDLHVALLLNFGPSGLQWKRIVR